jgi:6-pyruvoyltetrahydropterin/6-carboxytetrahydropterin synthase
VFEVGVVTEFSASHSLRGDFGPATRPHRHTYRVELGVRGERLREDGTLCDLALLEDRLKAAVSPLDNGNLDDVPDLAQPNSTAEVVARHFARLLAHDLANRGLRSLTVRVWESPSGYATHELALA